MRLKVLLKRPWSIISAAGIIFSLVIIFFLTFGQTGHVYTYYSNTKQASPVGGKTSQGLIAGASVESIESAGLPIRLKIPAINVDAAVELVGLTPDGAMDSPKERANVAWFNLGPRPGGKGSAVIAGHYGRQNGKGSVFDNLHKLRNGDKIYIEDEKGTTTTFVARESRRYDSEADASDVFNSNDGKPRLNLITCEGVWNETSKSYPKRLVIFTDKE